MLVNIKKTTDNPNTMLSKDEMLAEPATGIVRVVNGVHFIGNGTYSQADFDASLARLNRDWIFFTKNDPPDDEDLDINLQEQPISKKTEEASTQVMKEQQDNNKDSEAARIFTISDLTQDDDIDDAIDHYQDDSLFNLYALYDISGNLEILLNILNNQF